MPKYRRGSGSVYKRNRIYWITYQVNGKRVQESAKTSDRGEARALQRKKQAEADAGQAVMAARKVKFEDLIAGIEGDYIANGRKSLDKVKSRTKHLTASFAGMRADAIGETELDAFVEKRLREEASNAEINRELAVLRRAFNIALRRRKVGRVPVFPTRLKEAPPRAGFFEREEFEAVVKHCPEHLRAPMLFAYSTGWRVRSEILNLRWRNIDFAAGTIRLDVGTTKNEDGRLIYMLPEVRALLEEQQRKTNALQVELGRVIPWVFSKKGRPIRNYYKAWHRACREAKVPDKIPHDFRRTAIRNMVRAGIAGEVAMKMSGHKTRAVFDRYCIVADSDLRDGADKLARFLA